MFRRKRDPDLELEAEAKRRKPDRSWPTRIAWGVLIGAFALVVTRASIATVVKIHGHGMAPTIADGDAVLLLRSTRSIEAGDIVVYDPTPMPQSIDPSEPPPPGAPDTRGHGLADPDADPSGQLVNTAVVDVEAVERRFERMRGEEAAPPEAPPTSYRLGRVLAVPGDAVSFNVTEGALGLAINGAPIESEPAPPRRDSDESSRTMRAAAYERAGETRYEVLVGTQPPRWPGMELPFEDNPVQIRATGYLIVADNRDEGACCDSRELGWIAPERVRGEIAARIAASPPTTRDGDDAKRVTWLP